MTTPGTQDQAAPRTEAAGRDEFGWPPTPRTREGVRLHADYYADGVGNSIGERIAAIEREAVGLDVDRPFVVRQFEGTPWVPLHEAARLHDAVQESGLTIAALRNTLSAAGDRDRREARLVEALALVTSDLVSLVDRPPHPPLHGVNEHIAAARALLAASGQAGPRADGEME